MNFYIELSLIPNDVFNPFQLWSKLYTQIHLAFVEKKDADEKIVYGVSFPQYRVEEKHDKFFSLLGSKLRIFAPSEEALQDLNLKHWLERNNLQDYVHFTSIKPVPIQVNYLTVNRYRPKIASEKLTQVYARSKGISDLQFAKTQQVKEYAHRHSISVEEALMRYEQPQQHKRLPFIKLRSKTNAQEFSLIINQQFAEVEKTGLFGTYGLSGTTTVPHW